MQKSFLISTVTAAALGYAAGFASDGLTEASASNLDRKVSVATEFPNNNAAIVNIWSNVDAAMCPLAEAEAGLDADECTVETGTVVSLQRRADTTAVSATFKFGGTWVFGDPE